jgi:hypothetical protein
MSDDFGASEPNIFDNLPQDPEEAFLLLEGKFKNECLENIKGLDEEYRSVHYMDYIAQVIAAITELGLEAQFDNRVPKIEDVDYNTYVNFSKDVKHYRTMLEIRLGRRVQGYSVRFDAATKVKVYHYIDKLRGIFEKLEVEEDKREALFKKLIELRHEVERNRTRFDSYAALAIESSGVVGDVVEKSKVLKVLDSIAKVFWNSKAEQETKRLPAPPTPKRIEPPRAESGGLDDEIPF